MKTRTFIAAIIAVIAVCLGTLSLIGNTATAREAMWANVTNGKFANALSAVGVAPDTWYPPKPGEPACVQVDMSGSLTWCLKAKAAPDAPEVILNSGTADANFVINAWPQMWIEVTAYSSGSVSAWGVQGTR